MRGKIVFMLKAKYQNNHPKPVFNKAIINDESTLKTNHALIHPVVDYLSKFSTYFNDNMPLIRQSYSIIIMNCLELNVKIINNTLGNNNRR